MSRIRSLAVAGLAGLTVVSIARGQFAWNSDFGLWSEPARWTPSGPPTAGSSVTVEGNFDGGQYAALDFNATLANLTVNNLASVGTLIHTAAFNRTLNVTGTTSLISGGIIQPADGCTYSLGTLINQSNATLLNGAVLAAGLFLENNAPPAVIQWRGANIVRNEATIQLGRNGFLKDQDTGLDALRNFSQNGGLFSVGETTYVTPSDFTNFGLISVSAQNFVNRVARMEIGGDFANYTPSTGVLNGGEIVLNGQHTGTAEFAFPGADIRSLAPFTSIQLGGNARIVDSLTGLNGLRNLGSLEGGFLSVATALGLTPSSGTFEQVNGYLDVQTNGAVTIIGNLQQYQGAIINVSNGASLTILGNSTIAGNFGYTAEPSIGNPVSEADLWEFEQGSSIYGSGTIIGDDITIEGAMTPGIVGGFPLRSVDPAQRGAVVTAGRLDLIGTASLTNSAILQIGIAGTEQGTGYSVLHQTGAGGLVLDGTLQIIVDGGFVPGPADVFSVVESDLLSGAFGQILGQRVTDTKWLVPLQNAASLRLAVALPGDATLDAIVDIGDFSVLAANFNQPGFDWTGGNFDGDGTVGIGDFALLAGNFNLSIANLGRAAAVPEPAAALIACMASLLPRRRHRRTV